MVIFLKYRTYVALFVGVRYYAFLGKKLTRSPRGIEILAASSLSMRLLSSFRPALCQYPLSLRQIELHWGYYKYDTIESRMT